MTIEQIHAQVKCCISEKPLSTSKNLNIIHIHKKATWAYPMWGNFLTGEKNMAVAYVHDDYMDEEGNLLGELKYAVEVTKENEIRYHLISELSELE